MSTPTSSTGNGAASLLWSVGDAGSYIAVTTSAALLLVVCTMVAILRSALTQVLGAGRPAKGAAVKDTSSERRPDAGAPCRHAAEQEEPEREMLPTTPPEPEREPAVSSNSSVSDSGDAARSTAHGDAGGAAEGEAAEAPEEVAATVEAICAFAGQRDMERAAAAFRDLCEAGELPPIPAYEALIRGYSACGDVEVAADLLSAVQVALSDAGAPLDDVLCNEVLEGCARRSAPAVAERVLDAMEASGAEPSETTLSILVDIYVHCGQLDRALEVTDVLPKTYGFAVGAEVYSCLIHACVAGRELRRALEVHADMRRSSCPVSGETYRTLIGGCVAHGLAEDAARTLGEAIEAGPGCSGRLRREALPRDEVEAVLLLLGSQGLAAELGEPLAKRLAKAGTPPSARALESMRSGRIAPPASQFHERRLAGL